MPLTEENAAARVWLPMARATRGLPVTVTGRSNPTCTTILSPRS